MNYLVYIERAAENLQFFLWVKNYTKRFAELPATERALAPSWVTEKSDGENLKAAPIVPGTISPEAAAIFKDTDFAGPTVDVVEYTHNPFHTPPATPGREGSVPNSEYVWHDDGSTLHSNSTVKSFNKNAAAAFESADVKLQPCEST